MRRPFNYALMALLVLAAPTVPAQFDDEELQPVPLPTELRLAGMARVVTHIERPADCIAPVMVNRIDDEKAAVSARSFMIKPGTHSLNGKAMLNLENCPIDDRYFRMNPAEDLEVNFELGFTYYIGYYHKPENPDEWQLVVWNIETNP